MAKKFRKKFNYRRVKKGMSYTTQDLVELFGIYKGTVRNWCKYGLSHFKHGNKLFIFGDDLIEFLKNYNQKGKVSCGDNEMYCMKCKKAVVPYGNEADAIYWSETRFNLRGICPDCGNLIHKAGSKNKLDLYNSFFNLQTIHEKRLNEGFQSTATCDIKEGENNEQI